MSLTVGDFGLVALDESHLLATDDRRSGRNARIPTLEVICAVMTLYHNVVDCDAAVVVKG